MRQLLITRTAVLLGEIFDEPVLDVLLDPPSRGLCPSIQKILPQLDDAPQTPGTDTSRRLELADGVSGKADVLFALVLHISHVPQRVADRSL